MAFWAFFHVKPSAAVAHKSRRVGTRLWSPGWVDLLGSQTMMKYS